MICLECGLARAIIAAQAARITRLEAALERVRELVRRSGGSCQGDMVLRVAEVAGG